MSTGHSWKARKESEMNSPPGLPAWLSGWMKKPAEPTETKRRRNQNGQNQAPAWLETMRSMRPMQNFNPIQSTVNWLGNMMPQQGDGGGRRRRRETAEPDARPQGGARRT